MFQTEELPNVDVKQVAEQATSNWEHLKGMGLDELISTVSSSIVSFSLRLLLAIALFYVGKFLISRLYKTVYKVMTRREVDASLTTFVLSLIKFSLYFILLIIVIGILGVETSSFIAIFASAGVAVGMALSGTLQNFAGGVLILLLKPYKVGDFIEAQGYSGTVKSIQLFNTIINTVDNKAIILPNGGMSTSSINNYSLEDYRRVDLSISLAYGTNVQAAKDAILEIVNSDPRAVSKYIEDDKENRAKEAEAAKPKKDDESSKHGALYRALHRKTKQIANVDTDLPVAIVTKADCSPFVGLVELGDSAIVFTVRIWTHSSNYWPLFFDMNERLYTELPAKGFSFPFPQLDVNLTTQK